MRMKNSTMEKRKIILDVISFGFVALICIALAVILIENLDRRTDSKNFEKISKIAYEEPSVGIAPEQKDDNVSKRNIKGLQETNADCVGWLYIDGTVVDYPVMHTPLEPEKYLRQSFYGEYSVSGVPFMDADCNPSGIHLIIHGHNMRNDTMFGTLKDYLDAEYCQNHPVIEFETAEKCRKYEVFAVALIDGDDKWYYNNRLVDDKYEDWIGYIKGKSSYDTGVTPEGERQLLTLSTCHGNDERTRLVVVAAEMISDSK